MQRLFMIPLAAAALALGAPAHAAGDGGGSTTVKTCKKGQVYDKKLKKCVEENRASDEALYETARDAAYEGDYLRAIALLKMVRNPDDPRVQNYLGFANRKLGRTEKAMRHYVRALELDPDYILARSYMGQGLVADGDLEGARAQLQEIARRGGKGTWAYVMLENAIATGVTY